MSSAGTSQARGARPADAEPILQVLCAAFGIDPDAARPLFYQDPFFDLSHKRVLVTPEAGLVCTLTVIPASLRIGAAVIPLAGIAGVATHPQHQRRGHAGGLLAATVRALADDLAYPVAALFPYSYGFYRKFGWATASRTAVLTCPPSCLPPASDAARVRAFRAEDRAAVHRLHEAVTRTRTGACLRDARRWRVIEDLTPGRQTVVREGLSGAIEGYLFFEMQPDDADTSLIVHEMFGVTAPARRGLLGFLASRGADAARVVWATCPEDMHAFGLFSLVSLERCQPHITLKPGMMLRLVDVSAAFALIHGALLAPVLQPHDSALTIRAGDTIRPENARPVRLHPSGVQPGDFSDRDWLAADITILSQLYAGYLTPSEAAAQGLVSASSPEVLQLADLLFPARQPFVSPLDQF